MFKIKVLLVLLFAALMLRLDEYLNKKFHLGYEERIAKVRKEILELAKELEEMP